jgi:hypothetical protein
MDILALVTGEEVSLRVTDLSPQAVSAWLQFIQQQYLGNTLSYLSMTLISNEPSPRAFILRFGDPLSPLSLTQREAIEKNGAIGCLLTDPISSLSTLSKPELISFASDLLEMLKKPLSFALRPPPTFSGVETSSCQE